MVLQEDFLVEKFMDKYETGIQYNLGETCCYSLSLKDLFELISTKGGTDRVKLEEELSQDLLQERLAYGAISGSKKLKKAIANLYNDFLVEGAPPIKDNNIIITNGAIGANFLTFYSLVNPGDHTIVVDPSYQQLSSLPGVFSGNPLNVEKLPLRFENNFLPDLEELENLIKSGKTKLLVINNPNNPTGIVWPNELLSKIVLICKKHDIYLLCDEVYRPLYHSTDNPPTSVLNFGYDKAISTSSMSKAFSLAGVRLGWIVSRDSSFLESAISKRDYNIISVSVLDDKVATVALDNHEVILKRNYELCRNNLRKLEAFINESNGLIKWVKPSGGTTTFVKIDTDKIDTHEMCVELTKRGCLIVPGEVFDNKKGFLRIGYGNSKDDLEGGLEVFKEYLKEKNVW